MNITCPSCAATFSLDVALESESGREFVSFLASQGALAKPLGLYLSLFRSTRKLSWTRALKLGREACELHEDKNVLMTAMLETVEALRNKRAEGDVRALENQNYLKKVLKNTANHPPSPSLIKEGEPDRAGVVKGKRRQALDLLAAWGAGSLLRSAIAAGLSGLVAIGRPGTPAAEMICANADMWLHLLVKHSCCDTALDADRVTRAFSALVQKSMKEWPEPAALIPHLPARPYQPALPVPAMSDADREAAGERFAKFKESL